MTNKDIVFVTQDAPACLGGNIHLFMGTSGKCLCGKSSGTLETLNETSASKTLIEVLTKLVTTQEILIQELRSRLEE